MTQQNDTDILQEELLEDLEEQQENISDNQQNNELEKLKDLLARTQADYINFKTRSQRDKEDMIFFLKYDILKKILPRVDDLERILKNTNQQEQETSIFQANVAMYKSFLRDLESLWVSSFDSIWKELNPDIHEVMTQIPSETPWIIIEEFEKWYMLWDRVLRVAKVVVWA